MPSPRRAVLLLALLLLGPLSFAVREVHHRRLSAVGTPGWVSSDPDTLYQVRRVHRALVEGRVAGEDAYLDHPNGSPIPWPPYYAGLLTAVLRPFAPGDPEDPEALRPWVEQRVASAARVFGVLTTLLAAFVGWRLAGGLGAGVAGGYHALCAASVAYSKSGNGDHHAFVALVTGAILLGLSLGLERGALARRRAGWITGLATGALAGVLLGAWVGGLLQVVAVQVALAWLIVRQGRSGAHQPGLGPLGLGFHAAALAAVLPAVLASPWRAVDPWMVVNLSWFHPAFLLLGGLVFVPLLGTLGARARRRYPWVVAAALVVLFAAGALTPLGAGVRAGFEWVTRADRFMAGIEESRALVGPGRWGELVRFLGVGALLLPPAWLALARASLAGGGRPELVPWAAAVPLLALQAARQGRFADVLVLPLGATLAFAAGALVSRSATGERAARATGAGWLMLGLLAAAGLNWSSSASTWRRSREREPSTHAAPPSELGARAAADWLRGVTEAGDAPPRHAQPGGVLAPWGLGHLIEWAADRPTVATNFGSYVGAEGFETPSRFFMSEDPDEARALLEARDVRWVLVPSDLPNRLNRMIDVVAPELRERYASPPDARGLRAPRAAWFRTLGARLLFDGEVAYPMGAPPDAPPWSQLDFLRLVYASPQPDPARRLRSPADVSPAAWLWERVPGAVVEARGSPGEVLEVSIPVRYPKARRELHWRGRARAGADGIARLQVPYATVAPPSGGAANRDGWVAPGSARWSLGPAAGALAIPEAAVLEGATVRVP